MGYIPSTYLSNCSSLVIFKQVKTQFFNSNIIKYRSIGVDVSTNKRVSKTKGKTFIRDLDSNSIEINVINMFTIRSMENLCECF